MHSGGRAARTCASKPSLLWQSLQPQLPLQYAPAAKQSQYSFRHLLFLQEQARPSGGTAGAAAATAGAAAAGGGGAGGAAGGKGGAAGGKGGSGSLARASIPGVNAPFPNGADAARWQEALVGAYMMMSPAEALAHRKGLLAAAESHAATAAATSNAAAAVALVQGAQNGS